MVRSMLRVQGAEGVIGANLGDGCANGGPGDLRNLVRFQRACNTILREEEDAVVGHHMQHVLHAVIGLQLGSHCACESGQLVNYMAGHTGNQSKVWNQS